MGDRHQLAVQIARIGRAAPMTQRVFLHPMAGLVKHEIRQPHDLERICELGGVGEHRVGYRPIRMDHLTDPTDRASPTR